MAAVPQGAFAAKKMREREEKIKASLDPTQYSSKYMDSIWGEYNRYSVHNLKKQMNNMEFFVGPKEKFEKRTFSAEIGTSSTNYN